jgi:hypothetical protein
MGHGWFTSFRLIFVRLFLVFMVCLGVVGLVMIWYGINSQNTLATSIGSSLFSAATVSVFFKLVAYDLYLKALLRNLFSSGRFLAMLDNSALYKLIKDAIIILKKGKPGSEVYKAFEENILEELVGITTQIRSYSLVLIEDTTYGQNILRGEMTSGYAIKNSSKEDKPLFKNGRVSTGETEIPKGMDPTRLPNDPREIFKYVEFKINNEIIHPQEKIEYIEQAGRKTEVTHEACYDYVVPAGKTTTVSWKCTFLLDRYDYVLRHLLTFANEVRVGVSHPKELDVKIVWFSTSREPLIEFSEVVRSPISLHQTARGVLFPGNGFVVVIRPRIR